MFVSVEKNMLPFLPVNFAQLLFLLVVVGARIHTEDLVAYICILCTMCKDDSGK